MNVGLVALVVARLYILRPEPPGAPRLAGLTHEAGPPVDRHPTGLPVAAATAKAPTTWRTVGGGVAEAPGRARGTGMRPTEAGHRRRWWQREPAVAAAAPLASVGREDAEHWAAERSGPSAAPSHPPASGGRWRHRGLLLGLAVVLAAATTTWLVARGDGTENRPAEPAASTTTIEATTTVAVDPATLAGDAYVAFEGAFTAAAAIPDPDFPALKETATGEALADAVEQLRAWQLSGRVGRAVGPVAEGVRVISASPSTDGVLVRACHVNDDQVVVAATGQVVNADVVTRLYHVAMVEEDGLWKVSQLRVVERWEGVAGCAGDRP